MIRSLIIALVFALVSASAFAADTASVDVTATVLPGCNFGSATYAITFAAIDPTGTLDATASDTIDFSCNTGAAPTVFSDDSTGVMTDGTNNLAYSLAYTAPATSTGNVLVTGTVTVATYQAAVASAGYTETVTFTVNP